MQEEQRLVTPTRVVLPGDSTGIAGLQLFGYNRNLFAGTGIDTHQHPNSIELVYVVSGTLAFSLWDGSCVLHGGDLFLTLPGEVHSTGNAPTGVCEFYWIQLDVTAPGLLGLAEPLRQELVAGLRSTRGKPLHCSRRWEMALHGVLQQLLSAQHSCMEVVAGLLPMLCDVMRCGAPVKSRSPAIAIATAYIQRNIFEELPLEQVAQAACMSLPGLKKKFSMEVGMSPRAYINCMKVEQAKVLLLAGRSVTETAFDLSFSSSNYFSVVFRKFTFMTPTGFIESSRSVAPAGEALHE